MGRYVRDVQLDQPLDVVSLVMEDYVYHNRFSRADWNGEMVFYLKDGHGRERYMKWSYAGGLFHIEAWLKNPMGGEMDLDGVGGGSSRKEFRSSMDQLIETLKRQSSSDLAGGHVGSDPLHHSTDYAAEHRQWQQKQAASGQYGTSGANTGQQVNTPFGSSTPFGGGGSIWSDPGMIYGIIGIIAGSMFPILGIVLGALGLKKSGDYGEVPRTVRIVCILAIVVSAVSTLWYLLTFIIGTTL